MYKPPEYTDIKPRMISLALNEFSLTSWVHTPLGGWKFAWEITRFKNAQIPALDGVSTQWKRKYHQGPALCVEGTESLYQKTGSLTWLPSHSFVSWMMLSLVVSASFQIRASSTRQVHGRASFYVADRHHVCSWLITKKNTILIDSIRAYRKALS